MFRGIVSISLDNKNRLLIPAKYRCALEKLVVAPNPVQSEPCLLIYPLKEWEIIEKEITERPNTKAIRNIKRFFLGQAVDYNIDSNGRILLTAPLKSFANLEKKLILVGQGNKFELWNSDIWEELNSAFFNDDSDDNLIKEIEEISF